MKWQPDMKIDFLKSFLLLFGANIQWIEHSDKKISGAVRWSDDSFEDEDQQFSWHIAGNNNQFLKGKELCDFIRTENLNRGDKMLISEKQLLLKLEENGWITDNAQKTVDFLCDTQVFMVDDGEETDSFFIHFDA